MFIPVPVPRGVSLRDARRLRKHAEWYQRQTARYGPDFAKNRWAKLLRRRRRRIHVVVTATACTGSVL